MFYILACGKSDCQWGYYYAKGSLEEIYDYLIDISSNVVSAYIEAETPEEIIDCYKALDEDEREDLDFNFRTYKSLVTKKMSLTSLSKCRIYISDSDIQVLALTENEDDLWKKCFDLVGEEVKGLSGDKAADYLVEKYTTWN